MIAQITRITTAREWNLDSGATIHVEGSRNSFTTYHAVTGRQVMMANRDKADVCGVGTVQIKFTSGKTVTLHNVLHVPTISKSLVSVGKLDEHGFNVASYRKVVITNGGLLTERSKLGAHGIKSVFVGYAKNNKAYRLLDENLGVIIESRDAELFEDKFSKDVENPRASLVPTSTSSSPVEISIEINEPRRSTRARKEKSLGSDFFSYLVEGTQKKVTKEVIFSINIDDDPKIFSEAMSSRDTPL
ncbi:retrovirus-related pol polyprotein from transposon TNT 1-94 [Tanacetum coccineum]